MKAFKNKIVLYQQKMGNHSFSNLQIWWSKQYCFTFITFNAVIANHGVAGVSVGDVEWPRTVHVGYALVRHKGLVTLVSPHAHIFNQVRIYFIRVPVNTIARSIGCFTTPVFVCCRHYIPGAEDVRTVVCFYACPHVVRKNVGVVRTRGAEDAVLRGGVASWIVVSWFLQVIR